MDNEVTSLATVPIENVDLIRCVVGFRIALGTPDRVGDVLLAKSFDLTNHAKIPVALFAHDRNLPIGTCENRVTKEYTIAEDSSGLLGEIWFNQQDYQVAMRIFDMCAQGVIRGISPGFIGKQSTKNATGGLDYKVTELVEVSLCVLPEHPDALVTWVQKSLKGDFNQLKKIDDRILKHLTIPEVKFVSTTIIKKDESPPKDDKKPDDPPKDDKDVEVKMKPGAKALNSAHTAALAMKAMLKELEDSHDSPEITEMFKAMDEMMDEAVEKMTAHYTKAYPDAPELKAESGADHEIPIEEVKHLKSIEKSLKHTMEHNKRLEEKIQKLLRKG